MNIGVIGDTPLESVAALSAFILLYVIFQGGRNARTVAAEMYQMYRENSDDGERWEELKGERTLQENMGLLWFIPGLFSAWVLITQMGLGIFAGLVAILIFDWLSIVTPKNQGDYYAAMFNDSSLNSYRKWRKTSWSLMQWLFMAGIVYCLYQIYDWAGGVLHG